jgi:hypothetical protein
MANHMRIDRILNEGEAINALQRLGFTVQQAQGRAGLYQVSHPQGGGSRVFTVEQLCSFAEGATVLETMVKAPQQA